MQIINEISFCQYCRGVLNDSETNHHEVCHELIINYNPIDSSHLLYPFFVLTGPSGDKYVSDMMDVEVFYHPALRWFSILHTISLHPTEANFQLTDITLHISNELMRETSFAPISKTESVTLDFVWRLEIDCRNSPENEEKIIEIYKKSDVNRHY